MGWKGTMRACGGGGVPAMRPPCDRRAPDVRRHTLSASFPVAVFALKSKQREGLRRREATFLMFVVQVMSVQRDRVAAWFCLSLTAATPRISKRDGDTTLAKPPPYVPCRNPPVMSDRVGPPDKGIQRTYCTAFQPPAPPPYNKLPFGPFVSDPSLAAVRVDVQRPHVFSNHPR